MHSQILAPIVALVAWSLVVLLWVIITRAPAMKAVGIDIGTAVGGKPGGLDGVLPDSVQWKAHNFIHLMEQPTLFYAICMVLAFIGAGDGFNAMLAWAYVGLRVVHSLVQGTGNIIRYRFALFALSTLALMMLTAHAGLALLHQG
jgi:hypothetical protein